MAVIRMTGEIMSNCLFADCAGQPISGHRVCREHHLRLEDLRLRVLADHIIRTTPGPREVVEASRPISPVWGFLVGVLLVGIFALAALT
jgi:hypothetical protein